MARFRSSALLLNGLARVAVPAVATPIGPRGRAARPTCGDSGVRAGRPDDTAALQRATDPSLTQIILPDGTPAFVIGVDERPE